MQSLFPRSPRTTMSLSMVALLLVPITNRFLGGDRDKEDPSCSIRYGVERKVVCRAAEASDSLNSTAGGNFLDKMPRDCLRIIERKSKVRNSRNKVVVAKVSTSSSTPIISPDVTEFKDVVKALLLDKKNQSQAPVTVKAVGESCVTCGGAHS
ncbi:hypothetical protein Tco_1383817 [Tanacetum coccineum]